MFWLPWMRTRAGPLALAEVECQALGKGHEGQDGGHAQGRGEDTCVAHVQPFDLGLLVTVHHLADGRGTAGRGSSDGP